MIVVSTETDPNQKWRSAGTAFVVQEMTVHLQKGVTLRVEVPEDQTPVLVPGSSFEVVDPLIREGWTRSPISGQSFKLGPAAWQLPGFWERYFDSESEARETYLRFRATTDGGTPEVYDSTTS